MANSAVVSGIFGASGAAGTPTDQAFIISVINGGGSPTDQGGVVPLWNNGGSPTDQGNPPPAPIDREVTLTSAVTFAQTLAAQLTLNVAPDNTVNFTDESRDPTILVSPVNGILFGQILEAIRVLQVSTNNSVTFNNQAQRTYTPSTSNSVAFTQQGERGFYPENLVTFSQQVLTDLSKQLGNTVTFDSSVQTTKTLNIQISNIINFAAYTSALNVTDCNRHIFASTCLTNPNLVRRSTVILQCDADTVELRNPELGNTETIDPKRALNRSRGAKITSFRNPTWPKKTDISIEFTVLTRAKGLELQEFLYNCLGKEVTLTDYESRVWTGVITNPDTVLSELDTVDCNYSITLEFTGEPQ